MVSKCQGSEFINKSINLSFAFWRRLFQTIKVIQINSSWFLKILKEKHSSTYPSVLSQFICYTFFCKNIQLWESFPVFLNFLILSEKMFLALSINSEVSCSFTNFLRKWLSVEWLSVLVFIFLSCSLVLFHAFCSYKKRV